MKVEVGKAAPQGCVGQSPHLRQGLSIPGVDLQHDERGGFVDLGEARQQDREGLLNVGCALADSTG